MGFLLPDVPETPWDAQRLLSLRRLLGASQEEMARFLHLRPRTLQLWESGRGAVTQYAIPTLEKLEKRTGQAEVKRASKMNKTEDQDADGRAPSKADSDTASRRNGQLLLAPVGRSSDRIRRTRQKLLARVLASKRKRVAA